MELYINSSIKICSINPEPYQNFEEKTLTAIILSYLTSFTSYRVLLVRLCTLIFLHNFSDVRHMAFCMIQIKTSRIYLVVH